MPIYEYICQGCQARFERYVKTWREAVRCPACEGSEVAKQLSTFAFSGSKAGSASGGCGCGRGGCGCHH